MWDERSPSAVQGEDPPEETPDPSTSQVHEEAASTDDPEPAVEAVEIGFPTAQFAADAAPRPAVRAALALHRREDFDASRDAFAALVEDHPGDAMARFNLVCALSRLDQIDEAVDILRPLLRSDLPTFRRRLAEDEDLAAVRASDAMVSLEEEIDDLESAWRAAADGGLALMSSGGSEPVRAVVLFEGRVVPLGPRVFGAEFAWADIDKNTVVTGAMNRHGIQLSSSPLYGEAASVIEDVNRPERAGELLRIDIWIAPEGPVYRAAFDQAMETPVQHDGRWTLFDSTRFDSQAPTHPFYAYTPAKEAPPTPALGSVRPAGLVSPATWRPTQTIGDIVITGNRLRRADQEVELGPGHGMGQHRSIAELTDGGLLVVTTTGGHVMDLITRAGEVTRVHAGPEPLSMRVHSARLYVQIGDETRTFDAQAPIDWDAGEPLPEGVGLSAH